MEIQIPYAIVKDAEAYHSSWLLCKCYLVGVGDLLI